MSDGLNDEDFDSLAAEYVLGTLDADERTRANVLLDVDHGFRGKVRAWESRLGELHLMVEPVEADRQILERLRAKLGPGEPAAPPLARSDVARQIEDELAGDLSLSAKTPPDAEPAEPALPVENDAVAELERALEKMHAIERAEAAAEQSPEIFPESRPEPPPQAIRTSAPESVPRGPPTPVVPVEIGPISSESRLADATNAVAEPRRGSVGEYRGRDGDFSVPAATPRGLRGWRMVAVFMTLVAAMLGGLISAWRYVPDRLPPPLRPTAVLHLADRPDLPQRKPAPPGSEFDE